MWNDCPICGKQLSPTQRQVRNLEVWCLNESSININDYHYWAWFDPTMNENDGGEHFQIGNYMVYRFPTETYVKYLPNPNSAYTVLGDFPLPFDKFNSEEKIKKLLILV